MQDLIEKLSDGMTFLIKSSSNSYSHTINTLVKKISKNKRILFISLNKSCKALEAIFSNNKANLKNIYFIDAITSTFIKPKKRKNCTFVTAPRALTEISIEITNALKKFNPDFMIFDSLSTLIIYENEIELGLSRFLMTMVNKSQKNNVKAIFLCLKDDEKSRLIKEASMIVEKTIVIN